MMNQIIKKLKRRLPRKNKGTTRKFIFSLLILLFGVTMLFDNSLSRYIKLSIKNYLFSSRNFYFNCDKLSDNNGLYQLNNWDGVGSFDITFNLNNYKNDYIASTSDIKYNVNYSCSSNLNCSISKTSGEIKAEDLTDYFVITLTPNVTLDEGDSVELNVTVTSTEPYVKELSGRFVLNVSIPGLGYEIDDKANQPYFNFKITNTLEYYQVLTAFGNYQVGDLVSRSEYDELSSSEKANLTSALIRLDFDPHVVLLDQTSRIYVDAINYTTETIGSYQYINSITFGMDIVSSESIRFYKVDATENYTYPFTNNSSIVTFNVL